ncbi:hypothetical protein BOTBODRAFT_39812 [Botryobasidium botryosum FD-172 SS1]|uniref:C3H1-type domain-containing protein n=1 Tax=Botryobasidium botryosum (strain FD-172 SS1) TaxID=930990 RepID=A0A067LSS9_BOTB1|nr:hypothetical protein BOTBODRAFT_39812 [Botryobasidium botryosum FD-172 SS1]
MASSSSSSEAALLQEISRLSGAINRHKITSTTTQHPPFRRQPFYKTSQHPYSNKPYPHASRQLVNNRGPTKEVVIDGVTFVSDPTGKKLVRKAIQPTNTSGNQSLPSAPNASPAVISAPQATSRPSSVSSMSQATTASSSVPPTNMVRLKNGSLIAAHRVRTTKPHPPSAAALAAKRARLNKFSLIINKTHANRRAKAASRPPKVLNKPCKFFTRTGSCNRGLTCPYIHDPDKIAICPAFLSRACPHLAHPEACSLSHNPTPERVPVCLHFANAGRCKNGDACLYPHVKLGPREGVCRDFAVLGYCEKGLDCAHNHVHECPDFAESGKCATKGCKLPHVIRANRKKAAAESPSAATWNQQRQQQQQQASFGKNVSSTARGMGSVGAGGDVANSLATAGVQSKSASEEFISLTFHESSDEEDEEEEDDDEENDDDGGEESDEEGDATMQDVM